ncbi:MAG: hypothetical protein JXJ04_01620 [Spirochaetales bacterium]|nr:hypothetical protein [Spirochaetales bacterium]
MVFQKKYFILILIVTALCSRLPAQLISDPQDRIYTYLSLWHEKGYIRTLPIIRPYSLQVIIPLLKQVEKHGDPRSRTLAEDFIKACTIPNLKLSKEKVFPGPIHFGYEEKALFDFDKYAGKHTMQITSTGFVTPGVSYSGKLSLGIIDNSDELEIQKWSRFYDEAKTGGGVVETESGSLGTGHYGTAGLFFGTENLIFQAGVMRSSFGPFFDNGPVVTPEAPAAGHLSFTYNANWFSFSSLFLDLYAKYTVDNLTGEKEEIPSPEEKYLVIHNVRFYFTDWLNLGIIQSTLCGGSFNPVYLIPLQHAFFTQQLFGDSASSIIGLFTQVSLPFDLQWNTVLYVDDWDAFSSSAKTDVNGINFDSAQNKLALQTGVTWSPCYDIFKRIKFSYLMITPYMYTHHAGGDPSYLTYTHDGKNIGTILEPNSDQLYLDIFLTPLSWLEIDLWTKFTRHGNASEGFEEDGVTSDGTVFDDGFQSDGTITFYGPSRFLTQDIIEHVLQLGCIVDCYIDIPYVTTYVSVGYTYQYIWNKNLEKDVNEQKHFLELMLVLQL